MDSPRPRGRVNITPLSSSSTSLPTVVSVPTHNKDAGILEQVYHRYSPKKLCGLVLFVSIPVLFILFAYAFAWLTRFPANQFACSKYMSPPHARNRSVSHYMCADHDNGDSAIIGQHVQDGELNFVIIGDFGRDGHCCQRDVAVEMERMASISRARFVINTGDSFYEEGLLSVTDEEVRTSWADVYNSSYLRNLEWWGVLGNHDYRGSATAIMSLSQVEPRFIIESRWWYRLVDTEFFPVRFIMIDTNPMIFSYHYDDPKMQKQADGINSQWDRIEEQMSWLESQLAVPNEMKIVVGHHPAFSWMDFGSENRTFLEQRIVPLLERYNVTAYFGGHDHNLQYAKPFGKTAYLVSGAGSRLRDGITYAKASDEHFFHVVHGFMVASVTKDRKLKVLAVDMYGKLVDHVIVG